MRRPARPSRSSCAPRVALARALAVTALTASLAACQEAPRPSSFLRLELVPSPDTSPLASRLVISRDGATLATLCVRIDGSTAASPASVVLERKADADASTPVTVEVTSYDAVAGFDTVGAGEEFPCPGTMPPVVGEPQRITLPLCAGAARAVSFHAGATCTAACSASQVCGAGLSSTGTECGATACCSGTLGDACALPPAE